MSDLVSLPEMWRFTFFHSIQLFLISRSACFCSRLTMRPYSNSSEVSVLTSKGRSQVRMTSSNGYFSTVFSLRFVVVFFRIKTASLAFERKTELPFRHLSSSTSAFKSSCPVTNFFFSICVCFRIFIFSSKQASVFADKKMICGRVNRVATLETTL